MKNYREKERQRQQKLIANGALFDGAPCNPIRPYFLLSGVDNLYAPIRDEVIAYFNENRISWWDGSCPSGHVLSSQIACLNHLFAIRHDANAVLALINNVRNEFTEVLPIECDYDKGFIAFEVISDRQHLGERLLTRGSVCTSVDALILARHVSGQRWLIPIEWKYTERYSNTDKSKGPSGATRMGRYNALITESPQLKTLSSYAGSLYYHEPFYQLMRQTLWAQQMVNHKAEERIQADNYMHLHIIPTENEALLQKTYPVSGLKMEKTWRAMLSDQSKYIVLDPKDFLAPVTAYYSALAAYLAARYDN